MGKTPEKILVANRKYLNTIKGRCTHALCTSNYNAMRRNHTACTATHAEIMAALINQDFKCSITGEPDAVDKLCLDHCHKTGKFRGWIGGKCNRALGLAKDNPDTLRKLADYLERQV